MTESTHPSELYRTIHEQPRIVREIFQRGMPLAREAAHLLAERRRIYLVGTGTSYHAAVVGQHIFRAAGLKAWATTHQEFALYPPPLSPQDALVTISHRGNKRYGLASLERAKRVGMPAVGLTGQGSPMQGPSVVIPTAPQETSSTHTASYTANLTALALIASEAASAGSGSFEEVARALPGLPRHLEEILSRESEIFPLADQLAEQGRVVFAGAGPNSATAREGALKVKESSYLVSEGFELETILHGGLQALQAGDLAVLSAPQGPALDRFGDLLRALEILKARPWLIGDRAALDRVEEFAGGPAGPARFVLSSVPEVLSPILGVVPLQLLACFTAERRGTNPDSFREDDPVFARISASYRL